MAWRTLAFEALDTLYFRESRPHDAVGAIELASLFPPPARTVAGALRTAIGDAAGVDWRRYAEAANRGESFAIDGVDLSAVIGTSDATGELELQGPWLTHHGERLYPAPQYLFHPHEGHGPASSGRVERLRIGAPVDCHLGRVCLPAVPAEHRRTKQAEPIWLTRNGLEAALQGRRPEPATIRGAAELYRRESRVGIARNNARRTVEEGLLYQTRHVRPGRSTALEVDVAGLPEGLTPHGRLVRFGGEGRLARIVAGNATGELPAAPAISGDPLGIILHLLTPADLGTGNWLPADFEPVEQDHHRVWRGHCAGVSLTVHAAVIGKAQREGGWDLARRQPRPVRGLVPAGSAYYCTVEDSLSQAIAALHGAQIGEDQALGRGQIAAGIWPRGETPDHILATYS